MVDVVAEEIPGALKHLLACLAQGTTLARMTAQSVDFSRGRFVVVAPKAALQHHPVDFRSSNQRLNRDEDILFARFVRGYLSDPDCAVLLQDLEARLTDPFMDKIAQRHLAIEYHDELYWRVNSDTLATKSDEDALKILNLASPFPFTAFLYVDGLSKEKSKLSDADLLHVVDNLVALVVSVFDFDSYLIWWKDEIRPFPCKT
jgi:hypothetical protein